MQVKEDNAMPKPKFGLGIVCYENCDFLFDICAELRPFCDYITIGWQTISYSGNVLSVELQEKMMNEFIFLDKCGLINEVMKIENSFPGQTADETLMNEKLKRNTIYHRLCDLGMEYCMIVDSDEFHFIEDVTNGLQLMIENGYEGSYVYDKYFIKDTHHELIKKQHSILNFIQSCKNKCAQFVNDWETDEYINNNEMICDFTRTFHNNSKSVLFDKDFPNYHFGLIRDDIEEKISNYSQPVLLEDEKSKDMWRKPIEELAKLDEITIFGTNYKLVECDYPILDQKLEKLAEKRKELEKYDWLVVGCGLFGATIAYRLRQMGKRVLIVERRQNIGGNCYDYEEDGIMIHKYGPHIFHTSDENVWKFVNQFDEFIPFVNSPLAKYDDQIFNLPFNMNTFSKLWGCSTPIEAKHIIDSQKKSFDEDNLENHAISEVGTEIYEKFIKGYTEKQWGTECKNLPSSIIKRIPLRFTYDNNYFNDKYQGFPKHGYAVMIEKMLDGCDIMFDTDINDHPELFEMANNIVYSGSIDELFKCNKGKLPYRSLSFKKTKYDIQNYQGNAVINFTDKSTSSTRSVEYKHFPMNDDSLDHTIVIEEIPSNDGEPFYPIPLDENINLYKEYLKIVPDNFIIGGRLGEYKYMDMDDVISSALKKDLKTTKGNPLDLKIWTSYHDDTLIEEYDLKDDEFHNIFNCKKPSGYPIDINFMNSAFCEICTLYHVWKNNLRSEFVGFEHYRRRFEITDELYHHLSNNEVVTFEGVTPCNLYYQYINPHNYFIEIVSNCWNRRYGEHNIYSNELFKNDNILYSRNCHILKWQTFCEMMEFLDNSIKDFCDEMHINMYSIEDINKLVDENKNTYKNKCMDQQKRLIGFLAERITSIWLSANKFIVHPMTYKNP